MNRWSGRVAVVTGASSGIGAAITKDLIKSGMIVIGLARRVDRIEQLREQVPKNVQNNLYPRKCDILIDEQINETFKWIEDSFKRIDVLVNNAGICKPIITVLDDKSDQHLKAILQTNLWGLILCTKRTAEIMKRSQIIDGHIININSILGHKTPYFHGIPPPLNVYSPSKYAVTALTEVLRQEFIYADTKTKVTSISPGVVNTDIVKTQIESDDTYKSAHEYDVLESEDISNAVLYVLSTPPHVQIHELIIKPVGEKF